jgi:dynactin complex subunit
VEVVKEVPVDRIIEKEVIKEIINTKEIDRLTEENDKLKLEIGQITKALDGMNKAKFLKKSDLSDLYDE